MNNRTMFLAALALGAALMATFAVKSLMPKPQKADEVPVVVASRDLDVYELITEDVLKPKPMPRSALPEGALRWPDRDSDNYQTKLDDLHEKLVNRMVQKTILKDYPFTMRQLAPEGVTSVGGLIAKGMRAITIDTPNVNASLAGLIMPRSRVDIISTVKNYRKETGPRTATLLENVEVLAVDQRLTTRSEEPTTDAVRKDAKVRSVTLMVTPQDANRVELAQNLGTLTLALRNPTDQEAARTQPAYLEDIQDRRAAYVQRSVKADHPETLPSPSMAPRPEVTSEPQPTLYVRTFKGSQSEMVKLSPRTGSVDVTVPGRTAKVSLAPRRLPAETPSGPGNESGVYQAAQFPHGDAGP